MPVNKAHPDYPEYIKKCRELRDSFLEKEEGLWVPTGVRDGNTALYAVQKEHNRKLKELQKEYQHLFE